VLSTLWDKEHSVCETFGCHLLTSQRCTVKQSHSFLRLLVEPNETKQHCYYRFCRQHFWAAGIMTYGLRISMTNGANLGYGCMLGWRHSSVKSIGSKSGGQTRTCDLLQSTIWTLVGGLEVHTVVLYSWCRAHVQMAL
jgi:hypothetical protein